MIVRPHIVPLLSAVVVCAAGCNPSSKDTSTSVAPVASAATDSSMVFIAQPKPANDQAWSTVAPGDEAPTTFTAGSADEAPAMESSAEGGAMVADDRALSEGMTLSEGKSLPQGMSFSSNKPGPDDKPGLLDPSEKTVQLSEVDQQRYNKASVKLVTAINDEDLEAYRALFTDECWAASIPWWREMFAIQTSLYGRIARAYAPHRGMMMFNGMGYRGDSGPDDATLIIHFEEATGGALTITLDEDGLISKTNVYIKGELVMLTPGEDKIIYRLLD